jgi:hypothetical protein
MTLLEDRLQEAIEARKAAPNSRAFVRAYAREQVLRGRLEEAIGPIKKGAFHAWLGKKPDEPITDADIAKGMASKDPHVRKMAHFARVSRGWGKKGKKAA